MKRFLFSMFFVSVFSFSFAEDLGSCHLIQDSVTGEYTIVCSGASSSSGTFTNCVELKQELLSEVNTLSSSIHDIGYNLGRDYGRATDAWGNYLPNMQYYNEWVTAVQGCQDVVDSYRRQLYDLSSNVQTGDLYKAVSSIECAECPSSGDDSSSGSCSCNVNVDVDLSEIIQLMNDAQNLRQHISDSVGSITNYLIEIVSSLHNLEPITNVVPYVYRSGALTTASSYNSRYSHYRMNSNGTLRDPILSDVPNIRISGNFNIIALLTSLHNDLANELASLNNYSYHFYLNTKPVFDVITNSLPSFIDSATNFYSQTLFENTAVLGAFSSTASQGQSYHDFLTNYYIHAVENRIGELGSGDLYKQTNWFARVEALIAALVFTDEKGTNTVGVYEGQFDSVVNGASVLHPLARARLSIFSNTSSSLISSLRSLSNTFSSVADPGSVVLFNLPDPSSGGSGGGDSIGFETSDIRNFVDICRNVTTLAWVSVGLIFLFRFIFWTVRTSYSLIVFSWGVLSSIFSH